MLPPAVSFYDARRVVVRCVDVFWFVYCRRWGRLLLLSFLYFGDAEKEEVLLVAQAAYSVVLWPIENQQQDDAVKEHRFVILLVLLHYSLTSMLVLWVLVII